VIISRIIWLLLAILVGFVTVSLSRQVWLAYTSKNWPTTPGVVVAFYGTPDYMYSVSGATYTNKYASCNELFDSLWFARHSSAYAQRYPLGAKVEVHYNPKRPEVAVLETKFDSSGIVLVVVLASITSIFVAGFIFGWRFKPGSRRWRYRPPI